MTAQRWDDERLDRLADQIRDTAKIAENNTRNIEALGQRIENTAKLAENNTRNIEALGQRIESSAKDLDQRIENIAKIAENNVRAIEALGQRLESSAKDLDQRIESNARVIQALANVAVEAREERQQLFERMDRQQANIEGLRTETIRMLDILLNQRNQQDNSGENNS
jgi:Ni,Fe-hydrogenase III large subunit